MKTPLSVEIHRSDLELIDCAAAAAALSRDDILILGGIRLAASLIDQRPAGRARRDPSEHTRDAAAD